MGQVPVDEIVEWFGGTVDELELRLDSAFDSLVETLDWTGDGQADQPSDEYDWTAEALQDSGERLRKWIPVPPPKSVFRHATVKRVTRRGAPVTAAAAAACVGLVAWFSPSPTRTAQAIGHAPPAAPRRRSRSLSTGPEGPGTGDVAASTVPSVARAALLSTTTMRATATVAPGTRRRPLHCPAPPRRWPRHPSRQRLPRAHRDGEHRHPSRH